MAVRRKHIRTLVGRLLETHGIESPPVEVGQRAFALGIRVQYQSAEDELSGFLYKGSQPQEGSYWCE